MARSRRKTRLQFLLVAAAIALVVLLLAVFWIQRFALYQFDPAPCEPSAFGLANDQVVRFRSEDGAEVSVWIAPAQPGKQVVISFYGNYAGVGTSAARLQPLLARGHGLALLVYRGCSGAPGTPSEAVFAMDARALYDQLDALVGSVVPPGARVLHGFSLGSSVAAGLAAERPAAGLILEASYDKLCRFFAARYRLPMCWLMWRERHEAAAKLAGVTLPKLFLHGAKDEAVPEAWARALHDAAVGDKRFISYPDGGHADLPAHGALDDVAAFLAALPRW
jgi:hypothetical protein